MEERLMEMTRIDYRATKELGEQIKREASKYNDIYTVQIYSNFKQSLQNCFQGDDAEMAMRQLDGLRDDFEAMKEVVWRYGEQLCKAADNYEEDMRASQTAAAKLTSNRS